MWWWDVEVHHDGIELLIEIGEPCFCLDAMTVLIYFTGP